MVKATKNKVTVLPPGIAVPAPDSTSTKPITVHSTPFLQSVKAPTETLSGRMKKALASVERTNSIEDKGKAEVVLVDEFPPFGMPAVHLDEVITDFAIHQRASKLLSIAFSKLDPNTQLLLQLRCEGKLAKVIAKETNLKTNSTKPLRPKALVRIVDDMEFSAFTSILNEWANLVQMDDREMPKAPELSPELTAYIAYKMSLSPGIKMNLFELQLSNDARDEVNEGIRLLSILPSC